MKTKKISASKLCNDIILKEKEFLCIVEQSNLNGLDVLEILKLAIKNFYELSSSAKNLKKIINPKSKKDEFMTISEKHRKENPGAMIGSVVP